MKKVLVLGAPIFQVPIVKKAKQMGLFVGIVDINPDAPAFEYADQVFICSVRDKMAVLEIAKEFKPDGIVIGACDTPVMTGAFICQEMGLPGYSVDVALKATNKVKMLEAFESNSVMHPKFQVISKDNINDFKLSIPYPVISKPTDSAGGRGVKIVNNEDELGDALRFSSEAGQSGDVLVEEYMSGPEVSVEVIVVDGIPHIIQITDKITSGSPHFFEVGHSQPSILSDPVKEKIKILASKAVLAIGLENSPAHVEIIITKEGPKMVELGARMGADCITTYLLDTSVTGINMAKATIELALGQKPDVSNYSNSGECVGVRFITAQEGILDNIYNVELAEKREGVIKIEIIGEKGKFYSKSTDNSARFGYVVCKGNTTKEALTRCQECIDMIDFKVSKKTLETNNIV
ncbi:ATP-grasp domain-containing protein [Butyrivibrio sp. VCD2006]|uniref:ATP-grasp domain-containing protein n=1 Tax=Butyrivibrio sp. VCD2006 TaxID=1280664 RepID=UPI00047A41B5|nr:ATP-grasp domain-containing protein [Butyrivibrio sp. VCD2006]